MKVKVADLEPNPFRKMDSYPVDRAKVEALKTSIKEKTFWDNILVRKHKDKYQLAYGHHRWIALKELGIEEIDIPVRDIDDATMVKIMAEENLDWSTSPAVVTETILSAKEFLDVKLAAYKTWQEMATAEQTLSRHFPKDPHSYGALREQKVGRNTLVKFLGGNWTNRKVEGALQIIKDKDLDQKAVMLIPTMEQARAFRVSVKEHKIPKPTQREIAKTIIEEGVGKRDIPDLVAEHIPATAIAKKQEPKELPNLVEFLNKCEADTDNLNRRLKALDPYLKDIAKNPRVISRLVSALKQLTKTSQNIIDRYEKEKKRKESVLCEIQ